MNLTDRKVRNTQPTCKTRKLFDGGGLYLQVAPAGGKWWRFKYRFQGKEKLLSLGTYPEVSLKKAREHHQSMRQLLSNGVDPGAHRKSLKESGTDDVSGHLECIAREWFAKYKQRWSQNYADKLLRSLERDVFPWIGKCNISSLTAPDILSALRRIEERGAIETAHRTLGYVGQIMRYAVATGRAERDITGDLRGALPPVKSQYFPAIVEPAQVAELLRAIDGYEGTLVVRCALQLAPLVFVRPGELRRAQWEDINFEQAEWRYRVTKTKTEHIVPLSRQALAILTELQPLTGSGLYVFPSARTALRPMSDNAILAALRRMGISKETMTGHGFRAMARTILDEVLGVRPDYIEHQLAHAVRDPNGRAYNRTAHLSERHAMMQQWADYLDSLKGGEVVSQ